MPCIWAPKMDESSTKPDKYPTSGEKPHEGKMWHKYFWLEYHFVGRMVITQWKPGNYEVGIIYNLQKICSIFSRDPYVEYQTVRQSSWMKMTIRTKDTLSVCCC